MENKHIKTLEEITQGKHDFLGKEKLADLLDKTLKALKNDTAMTKETKALINKASGHLVKIVLKYSRS